MFGINSNLNLISSFTGTHKIVCVAFNPEVLKTFGIESDLVADRNLLINLAIDFLEARNEIKISRHFTLFDKNHTLHGCHEKAKESLMGLFKKEEGQFEADLSEIEQKFGPMASGCKDSFLGELANVSCGTKDSSPNKGPEITLNTSTTPSRPGLIEEVSSSDVPLAKPHYEIDTRERDNAKPRRLIVQIQLPTVDSVAECDLEISEVSMHSYACVTVFLVIISECINISLRVKQPFNFV